MFGVAIDGPADVFFDNQSVVTNVSIPSSFLKKKHNSICYHKFWEVHTDGTIRVGWIPGEYNKFDISKIQQYLRRGNMSYWILYLMRRFLQLQRNPMEMMVKRRSPHFWKWVIISCMERNRGWKQVRSMTFEWINETVARTPIHLWGLS